MKTRILILFSLVIIVMVCLLIINKNHENSPIVENEELKLKLQEKATLFKEDNNNSLININNLTDFEWDKLYIISPYMDLFKFCNEQNIKCDSSISKSIPSNDGNSVLLFVYKDVAVSYVIHRRQFGDLYYSERVKQSYSKSEAIFKFDYDRDWLILIPKS